ncbi:iron uptake transporter deferrochelatase/peroxidase subunit [Cellulomonas sp. P24]|uniref:iron uptake transporter deferrochelatase/peroxidase subunit n=1 Tax=Cellulomonas sp. P24 TaxID=2885206 RepID=UPI00216AC828|nr:iron uptake transporter deferrochelatase/peroxidase subunit [Cellulomonas sp. P24]MCR6493892.1 deferrochelatase/peroxidase EfeB [Cellulomonas sp. P24]
MTAHRPTTDRSSGGLTRRTVLGAGLAAAGLSGAFAGGLATARTAPAATAGSDVVPFRGRHQAGIVTPTQEHLHLASWDVTTSSRTALVALLRAWTVAADRLTRGLPAGGGPGLDDAPPADTGEAVDLPPARLTLTFGFGATLFETADGRDRFGLAGRRPAALVDLPHFAGDALEESRCGGDLMVQACADDPQVAVHAIRNLARIAFGTAAVRWSQLGYGRASSTSTSQPTPRNLFGFKDGTANLTAEQDDALAAHVWVPGATGTTGTTGTGAGAGDWMADGSYLVARRIRMQIETWDRTSLRTQERSVGRSKQEGAPLSGGTERTEPDLAATGPDGTPLVPVDSHVALAHPSRHDGVRMLRRGYSYTDGSDGLGHLDAGLVFLAYVRDPRTHYIPMQTALARDDALSEYLRHTGSSLWAVPRGIPEDADLAGPNGAFIGEGLLA